MAPKGKRQRKTYVADPSGFISPEKAQLWGTELTRILRSHKAKDDESAVEAVVADATQETSNLHGELEWDNDKAGHQHRLDQVRRFIRHVYVAVGTPKEPQTIRAFVYVKASKDSRRQLKPIQSVNKNEQAYLVERARRELVGWTARYESYKHIHEIGELLTGVTGLLDGIEEGS